MGFIQLATAVPYNTVLGTGPTFVDRVHYSC
jgi:hypothetical protein